MTTLTDFLRNVLPIAGIILSVVFLIGGGIFAVTGARQQRRTRAIGGGAIVAIGMLLIAAVWFIPPRAAIISENVVRSLSNINDIFGGTSFGVAGPFAFIGLSAIFFLGIVSVVVFVVGRLIGLLMLDVYAHAAERNA